MLQQKFQLHQKSNINFTLQSEIIIRVSTVRLRHRMPPTPPVWKQTQNGTRTFNNLWEHPWCIWHSAGTTTAASVLKLNQKRLDCNKSKTLQEHHIKPM